jgi:hypothetical protein
MVPGTDSHLLVGEPSGDAVVAPQKHVRDGEGGPRRRPSRRKRAPPAAAGGRRPRSGRTLRAEPYAPWRVLEREDGDCCIAGVGVIRLGRWVSINRLMDNLRNGLTGRARWLCL